MGLRGPQPTPTPILKLRGSWKVNERGNEPQAAVEAPNRPEWLSVEAKLEWNRLIPQLLARRTLTVADRSALALMCDAWGEIVKAKRDLATMAKNKEPWEGMLVDHPRMVLGRAFERWLKLSDRFGLSPAAKSRVQAVTGGEEQKDNRMRFVAGE